MAAVNVTTNTENTQINDKNINKNCEHSRRKRAPLLDTAANIQIKIGSCFPPHRHLRFAIAVNEDGNNPFR